MEQLIGSWLSKEKWAEQQRIGAFEMWCWRRLLKVTWTARRSNQLIWREINHEYSLEGLMLKLKLQYFSHLMWTADWLEKSLMLGKIEGRRIRACQTMRCWTASPMQCIWTWANSVRWWGTGRREANTMRSHALNEEQPQLATTREILHTSLKNQCNQNK